MNTLFSKIGTITTILLVCLFNSINVYANRDEEIALEGSLSPYELRSLPVVDPVTATINGDIINITFNKIPSSIDISIKEVGTSNIVYSQNHSSPQNVNISLSNCENGAYIIELRTQNGYMYGTFFLID